MAGTFSPLEILAYRKQIVGPFGSLSDNGPIWAWSEAESINSSDLYFLLGSFFFTRLVRRRPHCSPSGLRQLSSARMTYLPLSPLGS